MLKELESVPDCHLSVPTPGPPGAVPWSPFGHFVCEHQDMIYNVAYRLLGDQALAAKATQDTFTRSSPVFARFHGQAARLWLMQIVTSICREWLRRRRPRRRARQAHRDTFQAHLDALPLDQRVVVVLSDIQGLSYHDIAQVLGVSTGVVRSRLSQGRAALRDILLAQGELGPSRAELASSLAKPKA